MKWPWRSEDLVEWTPPPRVAWNEDNWCTFCARLIGGHPDFPQYAVDQQHEPECPFSAQDYTGPPPKRGNNEGDMMPLLIAILAELREARVEREQERELEREREQD